MRRGRASKVPPFIGETARAAAILDRRWKGAWGDTWTAIGGLRLGFPGFVVARWRSSRGIGRSKGKKRGTSAPMASRPWALAGTSRCCRFELERGGCSSDRGRGTRSCLPARRPWRSTAMARSRPSSHTELGLLLRPVKQRIGNGPGEGMTSGGHWPVTAGSSRGASACWGVQAGP
jgi:hypothetical protein